ncbi:YeeE/YedE family protein [Bacteroidia bacterium]|nr:YeeE/YedE family protein [Bacteroidia bacterium]MDB9883085.1 YeeE/YedE family protein [Bacteroidia bacterium]MDC1395562.1 YeeE/YedE family protein [Bacteroidia bacterium]
MTDFLIESIMGPWSWYVSGPLISMIMFLLIRSGGEFGVSSTYSTACTMLGAGKQVQFFNTNWREQIGNLFFVIGAIAGGILTTKFLNDGAPLDLSLQTILDLNKLNISFKGGFAPLSIFSWEGLLTFKGFIMIVVGGFLVGFGTRWAGGCTSGHAISGLSNLQISSLIAVVGFFLGGLIITHLIFPLLF